MLWRRRVEDARRARLIVAIAGGYAGLFLILVWQALRGQALVDPDTLTLVVIISWVAMTGVALARPFRRRRTSDIDAGLNWINP
jgi:hypothetical protein